MNGPTAADSTSPEGLEFHYADEAKPLATPWQVAVERAKMVRKCSLPDGPILDPACGSGIQLAAYCAMLGRKGTGIEMDEPTAIAANSNLKRVSDHGFGDSLLESSIIVGDGTVGDLEQKFAMLHLDPARPRNSRTHGLDEMEPKLPDIFNAWKDNLIMEQGPQFLIFHRGSILISEPSRRNRQRFLAANRQDMVWTKVQRSRTDYPLDWATLKSRYSSKICSYSSRYQTKAIDCRRRKNRNF